MYSDDQKLRMLCRPGFDMAADDFSGTLITEPDDVMDQSVASIGRCPDRHYDRGFCGISGRELL